MVPLRFCVPAACADCNRQRASNVDPYLRQTRLASFVEPILQAWQEEEFRSVSSSFEGFCTMLGLQSVGPYMQTRQAHMVEDWTTVILDSEGKQIQEEMTRKFQVGLLMVFTWRVWLITT